MLANRSVEWRGGTEFIVEEVGVKFSSKDAQQCKEGMKAIPLGIRQGWGRNSMAEATGPKIGNFFLFFH